MIAYTLQCILFGTAYDGGLYICTVLPFSNLVGEISSVKFPIMSFVATGLWKPYAKARVFSEFRLYGIPYVFLNSV